MKAAIDQGKSHSFEKSRGGQAGQRESSSGGAFLRKEKYIREERGPTGDIRKHGGGRKFV